MINIISILKKLRDKLSDKTPCFQYTGAEVSALDGAIKLLEKLILPQKWIEYPYNSTIVCPSCGTKYSTADNSTEDWEYCPRCAQRLD